MRQGNSESKPGVLGRLRRSTAVSRSVVIAQIAFVWLYGWLPNVLNLLARGKSPATTGLTIPSETPAAELTLKVLVLLCGAAAVYALWSETAVRRPRNLAGLITALLPAAVLVLVSNPLEGILPTQVQVFVYSAVVCVLWLHGPDRALNIAIVVMVVITCALSLVFGATGLGVLTPEDGVFVEKAILFDNLLAGVYNYNNPLGLLIAASVPLVMLLQRLWLKVVVVALMLFTLLWTGSRTSLLAVGIVSVAAIGLIVLRSVPRVRAFIASAALIALAGVVVAMPFVFRSQPQAFSARGRMWDEALNIAGSSLWFGFGRTAFESDGLLAQALGRVFPHGHNFFVTVLLTTGVVGVITVAVLLARVGYVVVKNLDVSIVPFLLFLSVLAVSLMETPGNFFPFERASSTTCVIWLVFALAFWSADPVAFRSAFVIRRASVPRA